MLIMHDHNASQCKHWLICSQNVTKEWRFFPLRCWEHEITIIKLTCVVTQDKCLYKFLMKWMRNRCSAYSKCQTCWCVYPHSSFISAILRCGFKNANASISSGVTKTKFCPSTCTGSWLNTAGLSKTVQCVGYSLMYSILISREKF